MIFSAIDFATHANLSYALLYQYAALGMLGIEDSSFALPSSTINAGSTLSMQSLMQRTVRVLNYFSIAFAVSDAMASLNQQRSRLGFATYNDPLTNIRNHPVLVQSMLGFEYSRPLSPLTRMVGMFIEKNASYTELLPQDEKVLQWIKKSSIPIVYIAFDVDDAPYEWQLLNLIAGVRLANCRALISIKFGSLHGAGSNFTSLFNFAASLRTSNDAADGANFLMIEPNISSNLFVLHQHMVGVFISSGSASQVVDAIYGGKPTIVLASQYSDRTANAARMTDVGVAVTLNFNEFSAQDVNRSVAMLQEAGVKVEVMRRTNWLRRINERLLGVTAGTSTDTAKAINEFLEVGYMHLIPLPQRLGMNFVEEIGLDILITVMFALLVAFYLTYQIIGACCYSSGETKMHLD